MPSDRPDRPAAAGGALPPPPAPQGRYRPAVAHEDLVVTAGMTPRVDGVLRHTGVVGLDVGLDEARTAAALAVSNALAAVADRLGSLDEVAQVLRMTVYVRAAPDFADHARVADGASEVLHDRLGERGACVRSAVGVASLPGGACVEVELTCTRGGGSRRTLS